MENYKIVQVLYRARQIDEQAWREHIPQGMEIALTSHDTAVHCRVYLSLEGEEPLLVWYKTNWVSSAYEFNENGKVQGIQPDCEFAFPMFEKFIQFCSQMIEHEEQRIAQEKQKEKALEQYHKEVQLDKYKRAFGG